VRATCVHRGRPRLAFEAVCADAGRVRLTTIGTLALSAILSLVLAGPVHAAKPSRGVRTITWSGQTWTVKDSGATIVGPGPNRFSAATSNVWVDSAGRLHLRIAKVNGIWASAEVISAKSFGYGTYRWTLASRVDGLDPNAVLGLFTWNDDPAYDHREIDVEVARWGNAADPTNAQFVVQPYDTPGNLQRFGVTSAVPSVHAFSWSPGSLGFSSTGAVPWAYSGPGVPVAGGENARMNLWLFGGRPPLDGQPVEVVFERFEHVAG
jgi:hypothetical protein